MHEATLQPFLTSAQLSAQGVSDSLPTAFRTQADHLTPLHAQRIAIHLAPL